MFVRIAVVLIVVFAAQRAEACSCIDDYWKPQDLMKMLQAAKDDAGEVFYARVVKIESLRKEGGEPYLTTLDVLEVFKGEPKHRLQMMSGDNAGDCSFKFEDGGKYLVYGHGAAISHCSRSRRVENSEDGELKWLRTGLPLPLPVSMQREHVACNRCDLDRLALELAGADRQYGHVEELAPALKRKKPFWTRAWGGEGHPEWTDITGLSLDGRPFRLLMTPYHSTQESCRQSVTLTYCKSLKVEEHGRTARLRCVEPTAPRVMCEENSTRAVTVLPVEKLIASCERWSVDEPRCSLRPKLEQIDGGTPRLYCSPSFNDFVSNEVPRRYTCRVQTNASAP